MKQRFTKTALALAFLPMLAMAEGPSYNNVTDARLQNPEARNWLSTRGNYAGWGYSPLSKINDKNVSKLSLAWSFTSGQQEGHQSPPIVNDGYMYVTAPNNQVVALDARNGQEIWRYKKEIPAELFQLHPTNRGVALYGDKVYVATTDCNLVVIHQLQFIFGWQEPLTCPPVVCGYCIFTCGASTIPMCRVFVGDLSSSTSRYAL